MALTYEGKITIILQDDLEFTVEFDLHSPKHMVDLLLSADIKNATLEIEEHQSTLIRKIIRSILIK